MDFAVLAEYKVKIKENELLKKNLDFARKLKKKNMEPYRDGDTDRGWSSRNSSQRPGKETGGIGDQSKNRDSTEHSINKIG